MFDFKRIANSALTSTNSRLDRVTHFGFAIGFTLAIILAAQLCLYAGTPLAREVQHGDIRVYHAKGAQIVSGKAPYSQVPFEYPPGALPITLLPFLTSTSELGLSQYALRFGVFGALACFACFLSFLKLHPDHRKVCDENRLGIVLFVLIAFYLSLLIPWRYDIFPALFVLLALYLVWFEKPMSSGVLLGLAIVMKVYPIVLIGVWCARYAAHRDQRGLIRFGCGLTISAISLVPMFLVAPDWLSVMLDYHVDRGVHIESAVGGILQLIQSETSSSHNYGAFHLEQSFDAVVKGMAFATAICLLLTNIGAFFRFRQQVRSTGQIDHQTIVESIFVMIAIFIIGNKVFSPQYMIWLLPLVPWLRQSHGCLLATTCGLTAIIYPFAYNALLNQEIWALILLNIRNVLLAILVAWIIGLNSKSLFSPNASRSNS